MSTRRGVALGLLMLVATLAPVGPGLWPRAAAQVPGRILAPAVRQLAWLDLDAPRPQLLTHFDEPAYVRDVAAIPGAPLAAVAVVRSTGDSGPSGSDLLGVDLASGQLANIVQRTDETESLGAPTWWFDGSSLLFQREDRSAPGISYPGGSVVLYPSRIEMVQANGTGRTVLVADGRQPAAAPDGSAIVFLRSSSEGTALMLRTIQDSNERVLVPASTFRDLASPRYSPQGDRIAFMAPGSLVGGQVPTFLGSPFVTRVASAHGFPWDLWLVGADGSGLIRLAQLGADDGTVAWSPDGSQLFIYGGTGSFLIDVATGEVTQLGYVAGYGATAWLPS
jgi:Tol biopolymer transport system component